jgi:NTP pyrophosphatase (non-canonical NTP hydrolase)
MLLTEYQEQAMRFLSKDVRGDSKKMRTNAALGLTGEAGEFADVVKKVLFHGHPDDPNAAYKLMLELGDVLWYCALAAEALGFDLDYVAQSNLDKLHQRYGGPATPERSLNRISTSTVYDELTPV